MIKKLLPYFLVLGMGLMISCEPNNPFDTGPVYDFEGNLKIDSAKIVAFLDTAQIDSLYRIHDPSGVVIIVQEEGVGTRPTSNTVVYTDYTGSLMEDGSVFDTSNETIAKENEIFDENRSYSPLSFRLGAVPRQVRPGFEIGFSRLRPGTKGIIIIPSPLGYEDRTEADGRITPNSILLFDIDFLGID